MKCPFRICQTTDVHNSCITCVHMDYENCHGAECPYWGEVNYGEYEGCRKVEKEVV